VQAGGTEAQDRDQGADSSGELSTFPVAAESWGEFRIAREIGRGGMSRSAPAAASPRPGSAAAWPFEPTRFAGAFGDASQGSATRMRPLLSRESPTSYFRLTLNWRGQPPETLTTPTYRSAAIIGLANSDSPATIAPSTVPGSGGTDWQKRFKLGMLLGCHDNRCKPPARVGLNRKRFN
jgi:hypothetical protein